MLPETHALDLLRSARLLLGSEMPAQALLAPSVRRALGTGETPSTPTRMLALLRRKLGRLEYESAVAEPLMAARREALGAAAAGPPRFLVRVDEFPHHEAWDRQDSYGSERYREFHARMSAAGVPYLLAVLPRVPHASLDPHGDRWRGLSRKERQLLGELPADGVSFGLHGLDHRTRHASPRRHSELCGLGPEETSQLLELGLRELRLLGIEPEVFVPPFNRFDAAQYEILAHRFTVVCGGPESVGLVGFQRTPVWKGEAVYLPTYHPVYGRAGEVTGAARRLIERQMALWVPIVLHWGWEAQDDWRELDRLLETIAPCAVHWDDFLAEVHASRSAA